jgi:hypothetical protein
MKLSSETLSVLQNFAKLNSGIEFKQGTNIKTISTGKTVLAKATLKDSFPQDFCVYDLNQFLVVYNLNKDTEIDFDDSNIIFKSGKNGRSKTKYRKSQRDVIVVPPEKELTLPSVDVSFTLSQEDYESILKTASTLQSPHIAVESDGEKVYLSACDATNDAAHVSSIEVSEGNGKKYKMVFITENLRLITGSYDVEISFKGLAFFKNKNQDIQYWVATESKYSKSGE